MRERATVGEGPSRELLETYPCRSVCSDGKGGLDPRDRAKNGCALPDFDVSAWRLAKGQAQRRFHLGLPPDFETPGTDMQQRFPHEPIEEGCPGAWYRSAFAMSLRPYLPSNVGAETWIESPLVHKDTDPLILQATQHYKDEKGRRAYFESK